MTQTNADKLLLSSEERASISKYANDLLDVYKVKRSAEELVDPSLKDKPISVAGRLITTAKESRYDISSYDPASYFLDGYYTSDIIKFFIDKDIVPATVFKEFAKVSEETGAWKIEKPDKVRKTIGLGTTYGQQLLFISMIQSRVIVLWMNEFFIQSGSIRKRLTKNSLTGHLVDRLNSTGYSQKVLASAVDEIEFLLNSLLATSDLENETLTMSVPKNWTPSTYQFNNGLLVFNQNHPERSEFRSDMLDYRFAYQRINEKFESREGAYKLIDDAINALSSRTNDLVPDERVKRAHIFNWSLDALQDLTLPGRSACIFMVSPRNLNGGTGKSFMYRLIQQSLNKSVKISSYIEAKEQQKNHRSDLMEKIVGGLGFNADEEQNFNDQALKDKYQFNDVSNKPLFYAPLGSNGSHHRLLGVHRSATNDLCWSWVNPDDSSIFRRFWEDTYPAQVSSVESNPLGTMAVKALDTALNNGVVTQMDLLNYLYVNILMNGFTRKDYDFDWERGQEILTRIGDGEIYFDTTVSNTELGSLMDTYFNTNSIRFDKLLGGIPSLGMRSLQNQVGDEFLGSAGRYIVIDTKARADINEEVRRRNLLPTRRSGYGVNAIMRWALEESDFGYMEIRNTSTHKAYLVKLDSELPEPTEAPISRSEVLEKAKEEYVQPEVKTPEPVSDELTEPITNEVVSDYEMKLTKLPTIYDNYNVNETYVTDVDGLVGKDVPKDKQEIILVNDRFDRKDHSGTSNMLFLDFDDIADWDLFNTMMDACDNKTIVQESASSSAEKRKAHVFVPLANPVNAGQYSVLQQHFVNQYNIPAELDMNQRGFKGVFYLSPKQPVERGNFVWNNPVPHVNVIETSKGSNAQSAKSTYDGPVISHIASWQLGLADSKASQWYNAFITSPDLNEYAGSRNSALTIIAKDICGLFNMGKMTEQVLNEIVENLTNKLEDDRCVDSLTEFEGMIERFLA